METIIKEQLQDLSGRRAQGLAQLKQLHAQKLQLEKEEQQLTAELNALAGGIMALEDLAKKIKRDEGKPQAD